MPRSYLRVFTLKFYDIVNTSWSFPFLFYLSFLTGVKHMLEMNDLSDYGTRESFAERMGKGVVKLEGHAV